MKIVLEYRNPTEAHCQVAVFVNDALAGVLTLRQDEVGSFDMIVSGGCVKGIDTFLGRGESTIKGAVAVTTTERPLIVATFKTPDGEITARVQRKPDGVVSLAWMTDTHVHGDWTLVRDGDGDGIEWMHGGLTVAPPSDDEISRNIKNALRNATRAMLAWVLP
jgi:hypothetical protein